jgi:hypothetical protein
MQTSLLESLQEVRTIVAELPPGEASYWKPVLDIVEKLPDENREALAPLLRLLAQSCRCVRQRLESQAPLVERYEQFAVNCGRNLEGLRQQLLAVQADLSEAEVGLLTKDFDRDILRGQIESRERKLGILSRQLADAQGQIQELQKQLGKE